VKKCDATPYSYDDDILLLGDPYKTHAKITTGLLANPFIWSDEKKALLMNGQSGRAGSENATNGRSWKDEPAALSLEARPFRLPLSALTVLPI